MSRPLRQSAYSNEKSERLEARLSRAQKELIQHAADLQGQSLTDFVISCTQGAAKKVIREHEIIMLTAKESALFVETLLHAPKPNAALKKAAKRHRDFIQKKIKD